MRVFLKVFLWAGIFLIAPRFASAANYYVSNTGSDSNNGSTLETPFLTIQKAADIILPGDVIFVRGGTYAGAMLRRAGSSSQWITIQPYSGEHVVIDAALNPTQYQDNAIYFYNTTCDPYDSDYVVPCQAAYWIIDGLEIRGGNLYTVKIDQSNVILRNNDLYGAKSDIIKVVKTADNVSIINNKIHDNNAVNGANAQAVDIVGADNAYIAHNHIYNIPSVGTFAKGNARNAIFEYNLLENIYDRGIMLGQSTNATSLVDGPYECYDCIARNNIIVNAGYGCFGVSGALNAKIYNNTCYMAAGTGQAGVYLSRESEIGTRNCQIDIRNNIIHTSSATSRPAIKVGFKGMHDGTTYGTDLADRCPSGWNTLQIDNNVYWNGNNDSTAVTFYWEERGSLYVPRNFATWRSITGLDAHSVIANPLFTDASTGKFNLQALSPAIDAGIAFTEVISDFIGTMRPQGSYFDIGAFEYFAPSDTTAPAAPSGLSVL